MNHSQSDDNIKYSIKEIDSNLIFSDDNYQDDGDYVDITTSQPQDEDDYGENVKNQDVPSESSLIEDEVIFSSDAFCIDKNYKLNLNSNELFIDQNGDDDEDVDDDDVDNVVKIGDIIIPSELDMEVKQINDSNNHHQRQQNLNEINFLKNELKKANMNYLSLKENLQIEKSNRVKCREQNYKLKHVNDELCNEIHDLKLKIKHLNYTNDSLNKDLNNLAQIRGKISIDLKRLRHEYDGLKAEYVQIMSERDCVHKEIEALQEQLCKEKEKFKLQMNTSNDDFDAIKLELDNFKNERNKLFEENRALRETISILNCATDDSNQKTNDLSLYEKYFIAKDEKLIDENDRLKVDVKDLEDELEVAKKRRDWAFNERDKMVKERESIRGLCDEFRHQRDKAISELAEALRDSDELKKQKNLAFRQISVLEENLNILEEKLFHLSQVESYENWKTLNIEIEKDEADHTHLGIHFAVVSDERNSQDELIEPYVVINAVSKSGLAHGKLKEFDRILKINEIDLKHMDVHEITDLIKNTSGVLQLLISRRHIIKQQQNSSSNQSGVNHANDQDGQMMDDAVKRQRHKAGNEQIRRLITIQKKTINDILLETGVYIAALKENTETSRYLSIGDRILSLNGVRLTNKSYVEIIQLIRDIKQDFSLTVLKTSEIVEDSKEISYEIDDEYIEGEHNDGNGEDEQFTTSIMDEYDDYDDDAYNGAHGHDDDGEDEINESSIIYKAKNSINRLNSNNSRMYRQQPPPPSSHSRSHSNRHTQIEPISLHSSILSTTNNTTTRKSTQSHYNRGGEADVEDISINDPLNFTTSSKLNDQDKSGASLYYRQQQQQQQQSRHSNSTRSHERREQQQQQHQNRRGRSNSSQKGFFLSTWPKHAANPNMKSSKNSEITSTTTTSHKRSSKQSHPRKTILTDVFARSPHQFNQSISSTDDRYSYNKHQKKQPFSLHHHHQQQQQPSVPAPPPVLIPPRPRTPQPILSSRADQSTDMASQSDCSLIQKHNPYSIGENNSSDIDMSSRQDQIAIEATPGVQATNEQQPPNINEIRSIYIENSNELLGININENLNLNCVYISNVITNGYANRAGICVGDQLLEICGVNLRLSNFEKAAKVLNDCSRNVDFIHFLVQYNPNKFLFNNNTNNSDEMSFDDIDSYTNAIQKQIDSDFFSQSFMLANIPRTILFKTSLGKLGVKICGGNNSNGIFVSDISSDCTLEAGDQLLHINSYDLRYVTLEKATYLLYSVEPTVEYLSKLIVKHNKQTYDQVNHSEPDSFHLLCLNDRLSQNGKELDLRKFDILHVVNTLPNGILDGYWKAHLIHREYEYEEDGQNVTNGYVPSINRFLNELTENSTLNESIQSSNDNVQQKCSKKRLKKSQNTQFIDLSAIIKSIAIELKHQKHKPLTYKLIECIDNKNIKRPCIILGALSSLICECLELEYGQNQDDTKFSYLKHENTNEMPKSMSIMDLFEINGNDFKFIDLQKLKKISNNGSNTHVLMSNLYNLNEIDTLKRLKLYPVILCLKYKNAKQLQQFNNNILGDYYDESNRKFDKLNTKLAKYLFEYTQKIEKQFKNFILSYVDINADNFVDLKLLIDTIKESIVTEQNKCIWIPISSDIVDVINEKNLFI